MPKLLLILLRSHDLYWKIIKIVPPKIGHVFKVMYIICIYVFL